jgi:hypothetical protein
LIALTHNACHGNWCRDQISTFRIYAAGIESRLIDPAFRTNPTPPAAITPKMKFKVTNWAEHETGLRRRGSMTFWIAPDALAGWVSLIAKPSVVIMPCSSTYMRE